MLHFWKYSSSFSSRGHIRLLIPILIMWSTWKAQNNSKFNGVRFSSQGIIKSVLAYLWKLYRARTMTIHHWKGDVEVARKLGFSLCATKQPVPKLVLPSCGDWFKLNCDSALKGNLGDACMGGMLRNNQGKLIFALYDFLGIQSNTYAELFALVRGLELAMEFAICKFGSRWMPKLSCTL
ncbi:UNVERIFIED_CONTAM: hypothetical protein Slati_0949400 [Sesamum latifolium]|uniref:RNase H type-1 domain-containing protein n=1 Tax=Sesamum latifolium TaxID=2727402 RepID=A0AAW2XPM1_9LAMI